jgi:hypothetical protein
MHERAPDSNRNPSASAEGEEPATYTIQKRAWTRWWEVLDPAGELVCLTVYKRGAKEVVRRLQG